MSDGSKELVPGLPLTRQQALSLPGMRRYRLVEFLVRWEHFGAARELLESLVAQKAGRFFYQYRLAQCWLATGDVERAKQMARALHASSDSRALGLLAIGDVFYVEGRLARAEEFYRQALEVEKTRESAQRRLAWCLLHRRDLAGAEALAELLRAGRRPAQLTPAAVRLLAAVASATGNAAQADALRRELKSRWQQELARLHTLLELPAPEPAAEPRFEEAAGLTPGAAQLTPETPPKQKHETEAPASGRAGVPAEESPAPPAAPPHPPGNPPLARPGPPSGYVYPTARERRAAAEAAAHQNAPRRQGPSNSPAPPTPGEGPSGPPLPPGPDSDPDTHSRLSDASSVVPSDAPPEAAPAHLPVPDSPPALNPVSTRTPNTEHRTPEHPPPGSGALRTALTELFGYEQFRPGQEEVVRHVLEGRSVLATMPTGRGKSLCFQLPAMLLPRVTVVISPLIALMQDQLEGLPARVRKRATVLNSSLDSAQVERRMRELASGCYSLIYAAPERLRQQPFLHALRCAGVSLLVVDEAHCISLWGQDFRPDYLFLPRLRAELDHPPLLAMTATATAAMQEDIRRQFQTPMETVSQGVFRPNLHLEVLRCANRSTKLKALRELCQGERGAMIVYVNARARAEHLAQALNDAGVSAGFYHAGLPGELREATQQRFMRDELRCLVATVAFGMGVDKSEIRLILHHDLPRSLEGYYQEAGRAGRDGRPARCVLFASSGDRSNLSRWAREDRLALDDVLRVHRTLRGFCHDLTLASDDLERETGLDDTRLRVAVSMLERAGAVRRQFDVPRVCTLRTRSLGDVAFERFVSDARLRPGQRVTRDTGDLCAQTGIEPEALEPRLLEWAEVGWLDYRGSARGLRLELLPVDDLSGRVRELLQTMEAVDETRLSRLNDYVQTGACRHAFLSDYFGHPFRAASSQAKAGCGACDNCRVLDRRPAGRDGGGDPRQTRGGSDSGTRAVGDTERHRLPAPCELSADPDTRARFERLRSWRRGVAQAAELPAFVVFDDHVLWAIARLQPQSLTDLHQVPGIGTRKAERYGAAVLAALRDPA